MKLPDPVDVPPELAVAVARRHGLHVAAARPIESSGIINTVISLDDRYVLRIPRNHDAHVEQTIVEAQAIPLAVAAGVRTPRLVAFDDSRADLPVPYLIVEFVTGRDVESRRVDAPEAWREVGRDLARLHTNVDPSAWPRTNTPGPKTDLESLVQRRVEDGWLSYVEAEWIVPWAAKLASGVPHDIDKCATHGDVQMSNVLVGDDGDYTALLDWGCASVKDPVIDFMPVPMAAKPALLAGHREIAPLPHDESAERRIVLGGLRTFLEVVPRGAAPNMTWGERPTAWLADLLRFFVNPPDEWRALAP